MKPLALAIRNFGPYAGAEARIDFTGLDRFFLIAGDTGSGKTSIFDAVSYAIYGKPLGTRNDQNVRSQFAPDTESCSVTFSFATATEEYEVTRSPHWVERKERGAGYKKPAPYLVAARRPRGGGDWRKVTKDTDAEGPDAALERAVGFSHDEFSKLVVLPQGQFQQFLEMDSAHRETLLRQLFPVEDHDRIAALASERARDLEQESKALAARQAEVRRSFDPDTAMARSVELEELEAAAAERQRRSEARFEAAAGSLVEARLLFERFGKLEEQESRLRELESETELRETQKQRVAAHTRAITVRSPLDQAESARADHSRAVQAQAELAAELAGAQAREALAAQAAAALPAAREDLQRMKETLRDLQARKRKLAELVAIDADIARLARIFDEAREELNAATGARDGLIGRQRELDDHEARARVLRDERTALLARIAPAAALEKDAKRVIALGDDDIPVARTARDEAAITAERTRADLAGAEENLAKAEAARDRDHAAALAEKLAPGRPCPVCGSPDHPLPATFGEAVVPDILETCQALVRSARERLQMAVALHADKAGTVAHKEEEAGNIGMAIAEAGFPSPDDLLELLAELRKRDQALLVEMEPLEASLATRPKVAADIEAATLTVETCRSKQADAERIFNLKQGERNNVFIAAGSPGDTSSADADLDRLLGEQESAIVAGTGRIEAVERELASARELVASRTAAAGQKARDLADLTRRVADLEAALSAAIASAGFADADSVRQALLPDAEAAELGASLKRYDSELDGAKGAVATLGQSLEGKERPELPALEASEAEARASRDSDRDVLQAAQAELKSHRAALERWEKLRLDEKDLRERGAVFMELSNDLNGLGGDGRVKLGFASFVLGRWLRRVLEHGSRRLATLSGGRYRFLLNEGGADGRKRAGLEIDVHDAYAGGTRGVGTLSGGEKFLASLSLALGLSDVIQAMAGGRRLDALFVDEGFGSLDGESLDRAIAVLDELGEGRQVGIISHVESLKKTIPSQVRVEKGPAGSRLTVAG